jgi:hypothetical protein
VNIQKYVEEMNSGLWLEDYQLSVELTVQMVMRSSSITSPYTSLSTRCGRQSIEAYAHGSRLSVEVRKITNKMVTQDEHKVYPSSSHELCNTLHPASLWILLIRDDDDDDVF